MNRRSDPGLGQWLATAIIAVLSLLIIYQLIQYSNVRSYMPTGMKIAGIDVGGLDEDGVRLILTERYLTAPITISHGEQQIQIDPQRDAEFILDFEFMLSKANEIRNNQRYWEGFLGYLTNQPVQVSDVQLNASHNRDTLLSALQQISTVYDIPAQPPQPVPATLSFLYGEVGRETNRVDSLTDIEAALYRPINRNALLIVEPVEPPRPNMNLLANLIVNHLQDFEGTTSIFIMDLNKDGEINVNGDIAVSGMSLMKVPIAIELLRRIELPLSAEQEILLNETLLDSGNLSANEILNIVAGQDNPYIGADMLTDSMQKLGLINTFMVTPYELPPRNNKQTLDTSANQRPDLFTNPDPNMQTTAEEIGALMAMIYYCAETGGGTLIAAFNNEITQEECQLLIDIMSQNFIGSLIEEGVPNETSVAHKHGWISDTHGDAGVVYTPNGDYVIVMFLHQTEWLEWAESSPLMADISRATYNYFNFDTPYLGVNQ